MVAGSVKVYWCSAAYRANIDVKSGISSKYYREVIIEFRPHFVFVYHYCHVARTSLTEYDKMSEE